MSKFLRIGSDGIQIESDIAAFLGGGTFNSGLLFVGRRSVPPILRQEFTADTWTTVVLDSVFDPLNLWDSNTNTYSVPSSGSYLLLSRLRLEDGLQSTIYGQGVHSSNDDAAWIYWQETAQNNNGARRNSSLNVRVDSFPANAPLRMYANIGSTTPMIFAELYIIRLDDNTDKVSSFNGRSGNVLLTESDIPAEIARDSEITAAITAHTNAVDPHSQYAVDADVTAVQNNLTNHINASDPHPQYATDSDVTSLQSIVDGKQDASTRLSNIAGLTPTNNLFLVGNGTAFTNRVLAVNDIPNLDSLYQPLDADLTAIAALSTQSFGRSLLTQANANNTRTLLGLGTAAIADSNAFQANSQILSDIVTNHATAIDGQVLTRSGSGIVYATPSGTGAATAGLINSATLLALVSHSGTTAETVLHTFTIPGGFLNEVGQHLEFMFGTGGTGSGSKRWRIRTPNSTTILEVGNATGNNSILRRIDYLNATTLLTVSSNSVDSEGAPLATVEIPLDWSQSQSFTVSVTHANTTDVSTLRTFRVRYFK